MKKKKDAQSNHLSTPTFWDILGYNPVQDDRSDFTQSRPIRRYKPARAADRERPCPLEEAVINRTQVHSAEM